MKKNSRQPARKRKETTKQPSNAKTTNYVVKEPTELLAFLLQEKVKNSRNSIKSVLSRGQVIVDGKSITQHNYSLLPGQTVGIIANKVAIKENALVGVSILHEDEDIIVINKEAGMLSMASKNENDLTAYRQLTTYVKEDNQKNRIYIVHRLDRDTSGVMLFAKSEAVKTALQEKWSDVVKERIYTALVEGVVRKEEGTISSWLTENKAMRVFSSPVDNGGKHAVTHYKKIRSNEQFSLLEIQLETGRKNQIRVHMEEMGHPVAGDKKYGSRINPLKRLGLHASTLALVHPRTGEVVRFQAKVPKIFLQNSK
ncbi:RluA family pseudouridine synthase [Carnobacterium antarcticum]|uniref:Pseudouridine synthase n=1 Tax=Carnobacterium antarcticum TaxID=2126436 RepID=A0ABW4NSH4_9LACT|nr:RluA family pseudouridine synthase [Carnobacterium sp. CP1]ALV22678.1 RNA pseudouridylate synthase [Carnobacterium sp. CP1]